jgi:hypothetical protein
MRPQQWSQARDGWVVSVDIGQDGSVGLEVQDGDLKGHLRLRDRERARVLASLLARAAGVLEREDERCAAHR